jgi:hypothetical protein
MNNASVFAQEEKVTMTRAAEILQEMNSTCFTICATAKVDEKILKEKLAALQQS